MARKGVRLPDSGKGVWGSRIEAIGGEGGPEGPGNGASLRRRGIRVPGPGDGIWAEPLSQPAPQPETPPARAMDGILDMTKEAREAAGIGRAEVRTAVTLAERMAAFEQDPDRDAGDLLPDFEMAADRLQKEHGRGFDGLAREVYEARMAEVVERARGRAERAALRKTVVQNRALLVETLTDLDHLATEGDAEDRDHYVRQAEAVIRAQMAGGIIDEVGAEAAWATFVRPGVPMLGPDGTGYAAGDDGPPLPKAQVAPERAATAADGDAVEEPPLPESGPESEATVDAEDEFVLDPETEAELRAQLSPPTILPGFPLPGESDRATSRDRADLAAQLGTEWGRIRRLGLRGFVPAELRPHLDAILTNVPATQEEWEAAAATLIDVTVEPRVAQQSYEAFEAALRTGDPERTASAAARWFSDSIVLLAAAFPFKPDKAAKVLKATKASREVRIAKAAAEAKAAVVRAERFRPTPGGDEAAQLERIAAKRRRT